MQRADRRAEFGRVYMLKKIVVAVISLSIVAGFYFVNTVNDHQVKGDISLNILQHPVTILRDELGIPYLYAENISDAIKAQGFIIAQDRLYQLELFKHLGRGKLSEFIGEKGIKIDTLMRNLNITAQAKRQIKALGPKATAFYLDYITGINAYIAQQQHEFPLSMSILSHQPDAWTLEDIISLQYFQVWSSSANWKTELLTQQAIDKLGSDKALEIAMVTINPDEESIHIREQEPSDSPLTTLNLSIEQAWLDAFPDVEAAASNAWATTKSKSLNGAAILVNSPHFDATTLPGFWYPMGLFTPEFRAVGVSAPGTPGFGIARTQDIAFGATNGYSDGIDLYVETLDDRKENHYLEGEVSLPLTVREEILRVKDSNNKTGFREIKLIIRNTRRGPLISDHGITLNGNRAISLRWATLEAPVTESMGIDQLLFARNVEQAQLSMAHSAAPLSQIVVDKDGAIARISTGHVPIRRKGDGSKPFVITDGADNWHGIIKASDMPMEIKPEHDWLATANHRVVKRDYPYKFSSYFSPSWRYRRISEYIEGKNVLSSDDHRALVNDVKNLMAEATVPTIIEALKSDPQVSYFNDYLAKWDFKDNTDSVAATLYQVLYQQLIRATFTDELGEELANDWIDSSYLWQERLNIMLKDNENVWFDNKSTPAIETRDDIIRASALFAQEFLIDTLGGTAQSWQWGKLHTITFGSPVIPGDFVANLFGGGVHPMVGSGETLNRGLFKYSQGYDTKIMDSVRFIADMSDHEKITAVIPGGVSGRYFDQHLNDQTQTWLDGGAFPIWFSDNKIKQHSVSQLRLIPNGSTN